MLFVPKSLGKFLEGLIVGCYPYTRVVGDVDGYCTGYDRPPICAISG